MRTFREAQAHAQATMTNAEHEEYDQVYEETGRRIDLAQMFYDARVRAGISQTELARRMGTKQSAIARIEAAGTSPSVEMLNRLAQATGHRLEIQLVAA